MPLGKVSDEVLHSAKEVVLKYERAMYKFEFHKVMSLMDEYIRNANKYWAKNIGAADKEDSNDMRRQVLIDTFHMVRTAVSLMHPIAPKGCEMLREYLGFGEDFWNWDRIFDTFADMCEGETEHKIKFLEPRVDFFPMYR